MRSAINKLMALLGKHYTYHFSYINSILVGYCFCVETHWCFNTSILAPLDFLICFWKSNGFTNNQSRLLTGRRTACRYAFPSAVPLLGPSVVSCRVALSRICVVFFLYFIPVRKIMFKKTRINKVENIATHIFHAKLDEPTE